MLLKTELEPDGDLNYGQIAPDSTRPTGPVSPPAEAVSAKAGQSQSNWVKPVLLAKLPVRIHANH
jgi:hypothetical protein